MVIYLHYSKFQIISKTHNVPSPLVTTILMIFTLFYPLNPVQLGIVTTQLMPL